MVYLKGFLIKFLQILGLSIVLIVITEWIDPGFLRFCILMGLGIVLYFVVKGITKQ